MSADFWKVEEQKDSSASPENPVESMLNIPLFVDRCYFSLLFWIHLQYLQVHRHFSKHITFQRSLIILTYTQSCSYHPNVSKQALVSCFVFSPCWIHLQHLHVHRHFSKHRTSERSFRILTLWYRLALGDTWDCLLLGCVQTFGLKTPLQAVVYYSTVRVWC